MIRGRADLVLSQNDDGPGAVSLIRPEDGDLFGYGAREAVVRALTGRAEDVAPFGSAVPAAELLEVLLRVTSGGDGQLGTSDDNGAVSLVLATATDRTAANAVAFAPGWVLEEWQLTAVAVRVRAGPTSRPLPRRIQPP